MSSISKWGAAFCFMFITTLSACDAPPTMRVATPTVTAGENVVIRFDQPIGGQAANQYWITLLPADAQESDATGRRFVYHGDTSARLIAPQTGTFQVRLHDRYTEKEHHLVATADVQVVAKDL